jgi:catechol 2,3-dioxygenase-like lactoylglutathione lyase family enzyme
MVRFNQINIITCDIAASVAFYRLLGVEIGDPGEWPPGTASHHAAVRFDGPPTLEFDDLPMQRLYVGDATNTRGPIVGFAFDSPDEVDACVARLRQAGHTVRQPPYDAFWGARYAVVEDPDGTAVGLMGPIDRARGYVPQGPPTPSS